MNWNEEIEDNPNETVRVYLAEIIGTHPKYKFKRKFLRYKRIHRSQSTYYYAEIAENGVFEVSISYFDKKTGRFIRRKREWFMLIEGDCYDIGASAVLFALSNLRMQLEPDLRAA